MAQQVLFVLRCRASLWDLALPEADTEEGDFPPFCLGTAHASKHSELLIHRLIIKLKDLLETIMCCSFRSRIYQESILCMYACIYKVLMF